MTIEMPITEVMELWSMLSHLKMVRQDQLDALNTDSSVYDYFKQELNKVTDAESKIEAQLMTECKRLDEAKDYVMNYNVNA